VTCWRYRCKPLELRGRYELGDQGEGGAFGEELTGAQDEGYGDQQGDVQGAGGGVEGEDRDGEGAQQVNNPDGAAPVPAVDQRSDRQAEHQPRDGAGGGDERHQAGVAGQVHGPAAAVRPGAARRRARRLSRPTTAASSGHPTLGWLVRRLTPGSLALRKERTEMTEPTVGG